METTSKPTFKHRQLVVWQWSMELCTYIYQLVETFPAHERDGLRAQLTRAAVSVVTNIAEGSERESNSDFIRFLTIARASVAEVDTQLEIATRLGYIPHSPQAQEALLLLVKQINALIHKLRT